MSESNIALVIAGGTEEPIDDVRVLTNRSTGRFGASIANALVRRGQRVCLLASPSLRAHPDWVHDQVELLSFSSFQSLAEAIDTFSKVHGAHMVFMAAAVADYSPTPHNGKLSSDEDELVIHLKRNPKLIQRLRAQFGDRSTLIGFKLLSNVPESTLIGVARKQLEENALDLCVANDAALIREDHHPIWLVDKSNNVHFTEGSKDEIAEVLVERVMALRSQLNEI